MTEQIQSQAKYAAAGLIGFALVLVGGGMVYVLPRASAPARVAVRPALPAAPSAVPAPAPAGKPAVTGAPVGEAPAVAAASPAPLLPDSAREAAPAPAAAAAPVAAAPAAPKLQPAAHLAVAHQASVSAPAASAPAPSSAKEERKAFLPPKLDLSKTQSAVASSVHYGVSNRAELMGRAAGPVYNFSGKKLDAGQGARVAADGSAVHSQVDAAQAQLDASPLNEHDKAVIGQQLQQVRDAAAKSASVPSN